MSVTIALVGTREEGASAGQSVITTSGTFNPTADRLSGVAVWTRSDTNAWTAPTTVTLTGGGMALWTLHKQAIGAGNGDNIVHVFRGVTASPAGAAALVFTAPGVETFKSYAICMWDAAGAKITGTNGSDGFVTANDTTAVDPGTDPFVATYPQAFGAASNAAVAFFLRAGGNVASTIKSGWTAELLDDSVGGVGAQLSYAMHWKSSSDTTAEATYGSSTANGAVVALEVVDASAAASSTAKVRRRRDFMSYAALAAPAAEIFGRIFQRSQSGLMLPAGV